jgi:BCD family chlorophyll transporter-like MFS transporter
VVTVVLNAVALWKQEARDPQRAARAAAARRPSAPPGARSCRAAARALAGGRGPGHAAFSMQDILLEPYGGQILKLPWVPPPCSRR